MIALWDLVALHLKEPHWNHEEFQNRLALPLAAARWEEAVAVHPRQILVAPRFPSALGMSTRTLGSELVGGCTSFKRVRGVGVLLSRGCGGGCDGSGASCGRIWLHLQTPFTRLCLLL